MKRFKDLKEGDPVYFYSNKDGFFEATVINIHADMSNPEIMYLVETNSPYPIRVYASKHAVNDCIFSDKEAIDLYIAERQRFFSKMKNDACIFLKENNN